MHQGPRETTHYSVIYHLWRVMDAPSAVKCNYSSSYGPFDVTHVKRFYS